MSHPAAARVRAARNFAHTVILNSGEDDSPHDTLPQILAHSLTLAATVLATLPEGGASLALVDAYLDFMRALSEAIATTREPS